VEASKESMLPKPYLKYSHVKHLRYASSKGLTKYPIGLSDWKKIKTENYFYWDRTLFMKEFYQDPGEVCTDSTYFAFMSCRLC
jgi:hypothetical protein